MQPLNVTMEKIICEAMIKPEELRIGDYVRVCGDKCMIDKGKLCEVVGIDAEQTFEGEKGLANLLPLDRDVWEMSHGTWCQYIEGIPISLNFLVKNNFEKTEHETDEGGLEWHVYKHEDSCVEVLYYPQTDEFFAFYCSKRPCNIAYVHELQNFLISIKENIKIMV